MPVFRTITSVRESLSRYKKKDSYSNCCKDLCEFFGNKSIDEIYDRPQILFKGATFRYLKSRLNNSNNANGKSGGYRMYYYVDRSTEIVTILGFYPKAGVYGRKDLTDKEEKDLIQEFKLERDNETLVYHDIVKEFEHVQ